MEGETQSGSEELQNSRCSFVWDENSQLYFHSSSGFYHDPVAGWYYSSRDGSYYKFENGSYVLLQMNEDEECKTYPDDPVKGEPCRQVCISGSEDHSSFEASEIDTSNCKGSVGDELPLEVAEGVGGHEHENPPTSLWLEDTLIDLFLSGYSNSEVIDTNDSISPTPSTTNHGNKFQPSSDGYSDTQMMEGERFQDDNHAIVNSNERVLDGGYDDTQRMEGERLQDENHTILNPNESVLLDEGVSTDEENWNAQYGQVTNYGEAIPKLSVVDIWDWSTVSESRTGGKGKVMRLVGRLVRKSAILHPSVSSNGALLKTAPVCEVHLDLVRVATGKIYKLHSPSKKYLTSMSTFDSSNPTKDWGFPDLLDRPTDLTNNEAKVASTGTVSMAASTLVDNLSVTGKCSSQNQYRDRAAERRVLHGGFGVGPGQKNSATDHGDLTSSPPPYGYSESSPAEALNISFGEGSYARKILKSMGWKEGEGLGNSMKGMVEPLQAVGNIGNAGLGWPQGTKKLDI